jgi:hypothetical protein
MPLYADVSFWALVVSWATTVPSSVLALLLAHASPPSSSAKAA